MEHRVTDSRMRHAEPTSWASCSCGVTVSAEPDDILQDRNEPLTRAWLAHRRDAGVSERSHTLGTGPVGFSMGIRRLPDAAERGRMAQAAKRAKAKS